MNSNKASETPVRLSVPRIRKTPRRCLSSDEVDVLRRVADTLIPASGNNLAASKVTDFQSLAEKALAVLDPHFDDITSLLAELSSISSEKLWDCLETLNRERQSVFYPLSLLVLGTYIYSPELKESLGYPAPHQNYAELFDAADELASGILDPVVERGSIYTRI